MPGMTRHILTAFWLCSTALYASGNVGVDSADSLFVVGYVAETPDSLLPETALHVGLGKFKLTAGDSLAASLERQATLGGWARGPLGRLQFDVSLPKYADSCRFWLNCDTSGLTVILEGDTSHWNWSPEQSGCFPLTTSNAFDDILEEARLLPFESSRLSLIVNWMEDKCAAADQIGRLAAAFDDDARRLAVIQSATCASPSHIHQLEPLFASQHYRSLFLEWVQAQD